MAADTADYFRTALEHAPASAPVAAGLAGWWTPAGWYVCAAHAGRILARGCSLPAGSSPVWQGEPGPRGVCCVCQPPAPVPA